MPAAIMQGRDYSRLIPRFVTDYPPLSAKQEVALCRRAQSGDKEAEKLLIHHNLRFVIMITNAYTVPPHIEREDLLQEAVEGLITAIRRFNPARRGPEGKPLRLLTYAQPWIRKRITACINENVSVVHVPFNQIMNLYSLYEMAGKYNNEAGEAVVKDTVDMAEKIGLPTEHIRAARDAFNVHSLDGATNMFTEHEFGRGISDNRKPNDNPMRCRKSEVVFEQIPLQEDIRKALDLLTPFERDVVCMLYGIGCNPKSMREVAEHFIYSKEYIRLVKMKAFEKMRGALSPFEPGAPQEEE